MKRDYHYNNKNYEYTWKGILVKPGDVYAYDLESAIEPVFLGKFTTEVEMVDKMNKVQFKQSNTVISDAKVNVKPITSVKEVELRQKLSKMKMNELREFGKKYKCTDTSKTELIEEIILKLKQLGEL